MQSLKEFKESNDRWYIVASASISVSNNTDCLERSVWRDSGFGRLAIETRAA